MRGRFSALKDIPKLAKMRSEINKNELASVIELENEIENLGDFIILYLLF